MKETKNPWLKFYPRDWRGDQALRLVSVAARGLWIEMLCIMHEAQPYGHLIHGGMAVNNDQLARMAGIGVDELSALLIELENAKVFSRTRRGVIYSRRMIRDLNRAEKGRKAVLDRWSQSSENKQKTEGPNRSPNREPITQKPEAIFQKPEDNRRVSNSHQEPARAPPSDDAVVQLRLAIVDAYRAGGRIIPPDTGRAAVWLAQGYPAELCLAVIRERMPNASDKSLNWFDKAIAEAFEKRPKQPPPPEPGCEVIDIGFGVKMPAKNLESAIHRWRRDPSTWLSFWGPEPPKHPRISAFAAERGIALEAAE